MKHNKKNQTGMDLKWILVALSAVVLIMGIWIGASLENRNEPTESIDNPPVVFSIVTLEIAREFSCPCGSCDHEILSICECPTAVSAKRFIEKNINNGLKKEEVIDQVKRVYGHYNG